MSFELILGVIGTGLGVVNFVYWAWWNRRDRVLVLEPEVQSRLLPKGYRRPGLWSHNEGPFERPTLLIQASCELVLRGEKRLEVRGVQALFNVKALEQLGNNFTKLASNIFDLHTEDYYKSGTLPDHVMLQPRKAVYYVNEVCLDCSDEFKTEYGDIGSNQVPEFLRVPMEQLCKEYQIRWERYDGKKLCWNLPDRRWKNLGKKLWGS